MNRPTAEISPCVEDAPIRLEAGGVWEGFIGSLLWARATFAPRLFFDNQPYRLLFSNPWGRWLIDRDRDLYRHRPLVFCASPGRAGSKFLATLLGTSADVSADHEPRPRMIRSFLWNSMAFGMERSYPARTVKIMGINRRLARLSAKTVYAETNHMFIKTFHDVVTDYYDNVRVIVLRRDYAEMVRSYVRLGYFSRLSPSRYWMHEVRTALGDSPDRIDLICAYLLDIEYRTQKFCLKHPSVPVYSAALSEISEIEGAKRLFKWLGIRWSERTTALIGSRTRVNQRDWQKKAHNTDIDLGHCRERMLRYIERARDYGIYDGDFQYPEMALPVTTA